MPSSVPVEPLAVDFWLDPSCPWSWVTARWLVEVQRHRPVDVTWHAMSLAVLNEGQELPEEWHQFMADSWGPVRLLEAAGQRAGNDAVAALVDALGRRLHAEGRQDVRAVIEESVAECGLPDQLVDLVWAPELDEDVVLSHKRAMALGGSDVGSPILGVPGPDGETVGFYGPIISQVPRGEDAIRLWDGFLLMATTPGFFELKRTRDVEPVFD